MVPKIAMGLHLKGEVDGAGGNDKVGEVSPNFTYVYVPFLSRWVPQRQLNDNVMPGLLSKPYLVTARCQNEIFR